MIKRRLTEKLAEALAEMPAVALLGVDAPQQKTRLFLLSLKRRNTDPGMREEFPQMLDVVAAAFAAVVRVVQEIGYPVQRHLEACAVRGFDVGTEMVKQGFDLAPVDIGAVRILKNAA